MILKGVTPDIHNGIYCSVKRRGDVRGICKEGKLPEPNSPGGQSKSKGGRRSTRQIRSSERTGPPCLGVFLLVASTIPPNRGEGGGGGRKKRASTKVRIATGIPIITTGLAAQAATSMFPLALNFEFIFASIWVKRTQKPGIKNLDYEPREL